MLAWGRSDHFGVQPSSMCSHPQIAGDGSSGWAISICLHTYPAWYTAGLTCYCKAPWVDSILSRDLLPFANILLMQTLYYSQLKHAWRAVRLPSLCPDLMQFCVLQSSRIAIAVLSDICLLDPPPHDVLSPAFRLSFSYWSQMISTLLTSSSCARIYME